MYCRFCGAEIPGDSVFCPKCGKTVNAVTPPSESPVSRLRKRRDSLRRQLGAIDDDLSCVVKRIAEDCPFDYPGDAECLRCGHETEYLEDVKVGEGPDAYMCQYCFNVTMAEFLSQVANSSGVMGRDSYESLLGMITRDWEFYASIMEKCELDPFAAKEEAEEIGAILSSKIRHQRAIAVIDRDIREIERKSSRGPASKNCTDSQSVGLADVQGSGCGKRDGNEAHCPKCGSTSLSANKKGYGIGKGVVGAAVAGPIGLVAGNINAKKVWVTCLKCGYRWKL